MDIFIYEANNGKDGIQKSKTTATKPHICDIDACFRWLWIYVELHKKSKYSAYPCIIISAKAEKNIDKDKNLNLGVKAYLYETV
jgi:hypothetical protein